MNGEHDADEDGEILFYKFKKLATAPELLELVN